MLGTTVASISFDECQQWYLDFQFHAQRQHTHQINTLASFIAFRLLSVYFNHIHVTLVHLSRLLWSLRHLYFGHIVTFILVASSPLLWSLCHVHFGRFVTFTLVT